MAVSKRARYEVLRRDDHTCRYCGGRAPDVGLTVDHVVPTALGGSDDPSNLVAACSDCNAGKTSTNPDAPLVAQVADDALRWSQALATAAESLRAQVAEERRYVDALDHLWMRWHHGDDPAQTFPRPSGWANTVSALRAAGLPSDLLLESATRALRNDKVEVDNTWRYFCGIAWNRVTVMQTAARASLNVEPSEPDVDADSDLFDQGRIDAWLEWYYSFERLQLVALSEVVDGPGLLIGRPV